MKTIWAAAIAILALNGCATRPENRPTELQVTLTGLQEVPGPGDPDGTGTAEIRVDPSENQVCWNVYARQIDPATAAHIHRGAAGVAGPPVVTITTPDAAGRSQGCVTVEPQLAREIATQSHNFYVNIHTGPHPQGAIRGQLRGGAMVSPSRRRGGER
ncbi:CHRD domain-containing protein [Sphingosinicella sp. LHD-64]|uniref:CHRD domain-containing protein n=1 Tax=Sphingosinicella sp. LHD-64 TaxID=3072139 RepID=UPI00280D2BBF|nr:CHRD domain-containing protein [Sphingosinicella sp. LHD-64]MDQ8756186.1 CHRD domain-containing protein [Sphingosinicella sp. LHD-64]